MLCNNYKRYVAFTLAEVLVTLTIIGVVAALTIPALIQNVQDTQDKIAYKKAFSIAQQVILQLNTDNALVVRDGWQGNPGSAIANENVANFNAFKTKFVVVKSCDSSNLTQCWADGETFWACPGGSVVQAFIDSSGMSWTMGSDGGPYNLVRSQIIVDTNGLKPPNKYGRDRWPFDLDAAKGDPLSAGIPKFVNPVGCANGCLGGCDVGSPDASYCPSGKCYYSSWLR